MSRLYETPIWKEYKINPNIVYSNFSVGIAPESNSNIECNLCQSENVKRAVAIDHTVICENCLQTMQTAMQNQSVKNAHSDFILQLMEVVDEGHEKLQKFWEQHPNIKDRSQILEYTDDTPSSIPYKFYLNKEERAVLALDLMNTEITDDPDEIASYLNLLIEFYEFATENIREEIKKIILSHYSWKKDNYSDEEINILNCILNSMTMTMMYDEVYHENFMNIIKSRVNDNDDEISRGAQINLRLMCNEPWLPAHELKWIRHNCNNLMSLMM
jgi:hypothetical protein